MYKKELNSIFIDLNHYIYDGFSDTQQAEYKTLLSKFSYHTKENKSISYIKNREEHNDNKAITKIPIADNIQTEKKQPISINMAENMSIPTHSDIEELTHQVKQCHLCALSRSRHNAVFGSGNIKSPLYIIGEAPGQEEDISGEPFVGRSGQLLTKMLEAIAIDRKDIFITNIVKCRPPSNRNPLDEEITACTPYLKKQIEIGKPKILLALGRYSAGFLLEDFKSSLGSLRGELKSSSYGSVLVTYHPAAVLRSPNIRKPIVWEDLKLLAHLLLKENFYNSEQIKILEKNKVL